MHGQERYNDLYLPGNEPTPDNHTATGLTIPNPPIVQGTTTMAIEMTDPWKPLRPMANSAYTDIEGTRGEQLLKGINYQLKTGNFIYNYPSGATLADAIVVTYGLGENAPLPLQQSTGSQDPANATCKWFDYYRTLYQNYTIVACHWKLTVDCPHPTLKSVAKTATLYAVGQSATSTTTSQTAESTQHNPGKIHGKLFWWYDQTGGGSDVGRTNMPSNETSNMQGWPGLKGQLDMYPGGHYTISDTWHFGKYQHNAINDKDITTWAQVGTVGNTPLYQGGTGANRYKEILRLAFKKGDWDTQKEGSSITTSLGCPANCKLELVYELQFRDLKQNLSWIPDQAAGFVNDVGTLDATFNMVYPSIIQRHI